MTMDGPRTAGPGELCIRCGDREGKRPGCEDCDVEPITPWADRFIPPNDRWDRVTVHDSKPGTGED